MKLIGRLNRALFEAAALATLVMAVLGLAIVVLRYGLGFGSIAAQETVIYLHAFVLLAAAAHTLAEDGHVRVDIFYSRWSNSRRGLIDLLGTLLLLAPVAVFVFWVCWDYVADAWARRETSAEPGGLAWVYLLKTLMLVFAAQLLLQGLVQVRRAWQAWRQ